MRLAAHGIVAVFTGLLLSTASAQAADLGGDCCADLEERVAELEATTARKGNRRMSLTVSGQINRTVLYWNDGDRSGTYAGLDNVSTSSRFIFSGDAKIRPNLKVELGPFGVNVNCVAPGFIVTRMTEAIAERTGVDFEQIKQAAAESTPLRRVGAPEEIASVVAFLVRRRELRLGPGDLRQRRPLGNRLVARHRRSVLGAPRRLEAAGP